MNKANTIRNLDPLSLRISANVGLFLYDERRSGRALEELNKALEVDPNHYVPATLIASVFSALGEKEPVDMPSHRDLSSLAMGRGKSKDKCLSSKLNRKNCGPEF